MVLPSSYGQAQDLDANTPSRENVGTEQLPIQVKGVFPKLTVMAKGLGSNSEAGIGVSAHFFPAFLIFHAYL